MLPQIISSQSDSLIQVAKDNDISYLAVYGSYARGEQTPKSDLDLLVDFDKKKGLFDLMKIEEKLSQVLGVKIDMVTKGGLNKYVKPYIQDDLKVIYAKKS